MPNDQTSLYQFPASPVLNGTRTIYDSLLRHVDVFHRLISESMDVIQRCGERISITIAAGGTILLCGNGDGAEDAQRIAAEFTGRFEDERRPLPAIALTTDTSALTAIANEHAFEHVFSRQVDALARSGDCLIGISTSGNSSNVIEAVRVAQEIGCTTIGMTGERESKLSAMCDLTVSFPSSRTSWIQEAHITMGHIWCEMVDRSLLI
jgi:D-sedoheptulose 7-phosphate isomerase